MSSHVQGEGGLVEPEGVNAGGPVGGGPGPADPDDQELAGTNGGEEPPSEAEGQGSGELLSRPGSDHGMTHPGPGQEVSAGEG